MKMYFVSPDSKIAKMKNPRTGFYQWSRLTKSLPSAGGALILGDGVEDSRVVIPVYGVGNDYQIGRTPHGYILRASRNATSGTRCLAVIDADSDTECYRHSILPPDGGEPLDNETARRFGLELLITTSYTLHMSSGIFRYNVYLAIVNHFAAFRMLTKRGDMIFFYNGYDDKWHSCTPEEWNVVSQVESEKGQIQWL